MQVSSNTTGMLAGVTGATDKDGRDYAVVVVKGTFVVDDKGDVLLADEQEPFVYADAHHGDPGATSIKYECDFAPYKPRCDVLLRAYAVAPWDEPVAELTVSVEVGSLKKHLRIVGDRRWEAGVFRTTATPPTKFAQMPIVFERAFGGADYSHADQNRHAVEMRNLVGVGFRVNSDPKIIDGSPLPNVEYPDQRLERWNDTPTPAGFGILGRGWQPRIRHAGTYDQAWLDARFPFLPADFDERYFQAAPEDQQLPELTGGTVVRCTNLSPGGSLVFKIPRVTIPIAFRFRDREHAAEPRLDTMLIEPHRRRFLLTWRTRVAVGRKFQALREILVGTPSKPKPRRSTTVRRFESLAEVVAWRRGRIGRPREESG